MTSNTQTLIDSADDTIHEDNSLLECGIHGLYPISLKAYGCPDCIQEKLDDDEEFEWRQSRKKYQG